MEDLTGRQFGSYQVVAPLGEGGMAAVYKGFQPGMDRYVALKVLPQHFAKDPQFVARFQQEAKVLAQLQHPHILPVFDYGEADGYTYIVMPFLKSGTLNDRLKGEPLPYQRIGKIVSQVGDALDYAHTRGLIHRDVKPSNVLIDERGNCLLTDFGLAKILEGNAKLTTSGAIMGTPAYMSPEQGLGRALDGRTDIYSLGVILYEMAVGRAPYNAETPMAIVIKHINDPLPPPGSVMPGFPEPLERVILKSLAKDPADRYQSAGAMVEALQSALAEIEGAAPTKVVKGGPTKVDATVSVRTPETEVKPSLEAKPTIAAAPPKKQSFPAWRVVAALAVVGVLVVGGGFGAAMFFSRGLGGAASAPVGTGQAGLSPTFTSAGQSLLEEDFEDGQAQDWSPVIGDVQVVQLSDGNHALQFVQSQYGDAQAVLTPSWAWGDQGFVFEADAMAEDVELYGTSLQLQVRVGSTRTSQTCLNYMGTLGAGWTSLGKMTSDTNDCNGNWQTTALSPGNVIELKPDTWRHLRLEVQGYHLQWYVDGTLFESAVDIGKTYSNGGIGLAVFNTSKAYFDNLTVRPLGDAPLPTSGTANWVISFVHFFPPNFWSDGVHEYTLSISCPGLPGGSSTFTQAFTVSDSLEKPGVESYLFLRRNGVKNAIVEGEAAAEFHPAYNTAGVISLPLFTGANLTRALADKAVTDCAATISWDGGDPVPLVPAMMFQP